MNINTVNHIVMYVTLRWSLASAVNKSNVS